jgi:hypothetical protein
MIAAQGTFTSPDSVIDGVDVVVAAATVAGCAVVAALDSGPFGEVATYLPGRKVAGVAVRDGRVTVQVRARWGIPAPDLAALITVALAPLTGHRPVDVVIADVDDPPAAPPGREPAGAGSPRPGPGLPLA